MANREGNFSFVLNVFEVCTWRCLIVSWKYRSPFQELRANSKGLGLIQEVFIECLPCATAVGSGHRAVNKADKILVVMEFIFY